MMVCLATSRLEDKKISLKPPAFGLPVDQQKGGLGVPQGHLHASKVSLVNDEPWHNLKPPT
eukprot:2685412-Prymnesium_polylepis.1